MKKRLLGMFLALMLALAPAFVMGAAEADKAVTVGGGLATYDIYDEDAMGSDDDEGLATQQSIKAYFDAAAFGSGLISATEIADVIREIYLPMAGWAVDGGDDIDENTAPDIGDDDNIPSITWDNSGETGAIQATFRLPSTYVSGLTIYCLVSSDTDVGIAGALDWRIWVNNDGVAFDATAIEQSEVLMGSASNPDVSNEVLTLTLNATGETACIAGTWVTVDIFNATSHESANLKLKGTHGTCNSTM